ncbi:MAG TPA: hypothetical protein VF510_25725 [Ktedonobacterales bacterium]
MEWLIGRRPSGGECRSSRSTWCGTWRALNVVMLAVVALASMAFLSAATGGLIPVARADTPKLNIIVPHPADKQTRGPVGTNITVRAEGLSPSGVYALGYARAEIACDAGFQPFQNETETMTETAGADGTFTATISWPSSLDSVGVSYYICAQSATPAGALLAPFAQSVETFRVDAANPPSIDVATAGATPGVGTPAASPLPDGSFYQGSAVTITGHNFAPGGSTLLVAVTSKQLQQPADFQAAARTSLPTADGGLKIKSQSSGDISATVGLPASLAPDSYYVYVFSTDGADQAIPSLVASKQITVVAAPTPVPTATTAPTATPTGTPPNTGGTFNLNNPTGVIALAVLSILLFIAGVIALLSAAAMPGPTRS